MTPSFKDHFSALADVYSRYRPGYPDSLFDFLATLAPAHDLAWDCGTGNGQAAVGLARHFRRVIATDPSEQQIAHAIPHHAVCYGVGSAEAPPAAARGADLVTAAQALHWFDFDRFYRAVQQVIKPGGIFAAWGYGLMQITPEVNEVINHYYTNVVGSYWPADRRHIESCYQTIPFPLDEVQAPAFSLAAQWDLDTLIGYLDTWSATRRYMKEHDRHPAELIRPALVAAWGTTVDRRIVWPLFLRAGRFID